MQSDPRTHVKQLAWIVVGIWATCWIGASLIDVFADDEGGFIDRLFPLYDLSAIWTRLFLLVALLLLSAYIQVIFTRLWEAQETLRKSEERYRNLFEYANDSILIANPQSHRLLDVNEKATDYLGYAREELLRQRIDDLVSPPTLTSLETAFADIAKGGSAIIELEFLRKDGTVMPIEFSSRLVKYDREHAIQIFGRDIRDRKLMEEQVSRAQRLEMAARIAGQVAHDFNNLLSPLAGYPELIKMDLPPGHPAAGYCDVMMGAARQMADMNEDLLTLSRRGHVNFEYVNLNGLISQALGPMLHQPNGVTVRLDLGHEILPISGSSAQISRVVSNLVSNAREAVQDVGQIRVKTDNVYIDKPFGRYSRVEIGEYARLQVSDDGNGIPSEIRHKIFDPFFTTKRADRRAGTGLGLSIVHVIVDDHNGYLDVESEAENGTTFSIYFPVDRNAKKEERNEIYEHGTETILVVDDDETQRELLSLRLATLGYSVSAVSSGEEAVAFLRKHPVDLMVLDMIMSPGIDGTETYRQAVMERPGQRALILSGFAQTERVVEAQALGAGAYLRKPVNLPALARAVRLELSREKQEPQSAVTT